MISPGTREVPENFRFPVFFSQGVGILETESDIYRCQRHSQRSEVNRRFNVTKTIPGIPTRIHHGTHKDVTRPAPRKPSTPSSSTCTRLLIGSVEAAFTPGLPERDHLRARRREPVSLLVTDVSSSNRNVPPGHFARMPRAEWLVISNELS